jgi:hypothetical protein
MALGLLSCGTFVGADFSSVRLGQFSCFDIASYEHIASFSDGIAEIP